MVYSKNKKLPKDIIKQKKLNQHDLPKMPKKDLYKELPDLVKPTSNILHHAQADGIGIAKPMEEAQKNLDVLINSKNPTHQSKRGIHHGQKMNVDKKVKLHLPNNIILTSRGVINNYGLPPN